MKDETNNKNKSTNSVSKKNEKGDKTPKKKKTSSVRLTAKQKEDIQEIIEQSCLEYMEILEQNIHTVKTQDMTHMGNMIREFMGPFILLGYNLNNEPVEVVVAENEQDADSLNERFKKFMIKQMMQQQNGGNGFL